jgi:hypothetical protein
MMLQASNRLVEAEPLMRRGLEISFDLECETGRTDPKCAAALVEYATLLAGTGKSQAEIRAIISDLMQDPGRGP